MKTIFGQLVWLAQVDYLFGFRINGPDNSIIVMSSYLPNG